MNKEDRTRLPNRFARSAGKIHAKHPWIAEILGWYGIAAILLAYALVSFEVLSADGYAYQLLNLTGAIGVVIISITKKAAQPAVLNIIWAVIALVAITVLAL